MPNLAAVIESTDDTQKIRIISKKIYSPQTWDEQNLGLMKDILESIVEQNSEVKEFLLNTGDSVLMETVDGEYFWSAGLSREVVNKTDITKLPGKNMMGQLWMEIRQNMRRKMSKESLDSDVIKTDHGPSEGDRGKKRNNSQQQRDYNQKAVKPRQDKKTPDKHSSKATPCRLAKTK